MGKKKGHGDHGGHGGVDPNGWMMSYADMVTILLAMFIVLSTMSQDQTGISLYRGTGSYKQAVNALGMPGLFGNYSNAVPLPGGGSHYSVENTDPDSKGAESDQHLRDGEEEQFQAFLLDIKQNFPLDKQPKESGRAAVDFHAKPSSTKPMLTDHQKDLVTPLLNLLRQKNYRLEVIVWAPTPADSACIRSLRTAQELRKELIDDVNLPDDERSRVIAVCRPWGSKDDKRPFFSLEVTKVRAGN